MPPGVAVLFVFAAAAFAGWEEVDAAGVFQVADRDDVPDVFGDDIGDEGVDVALAVGVQGEVVGAEGVSAVGGFAVRGFDLHAGEGAAAVVRVEDEVVGFAVAPGFEDGEAEVSGFGEEESFGNFSETLGGELEAAARASGAEARLAAGERGAALGFRVWAGFGLGRGGEGEWSVVRLIGTSLCEFR